MHADLFLIISKIMEPPEEFGLKSTSQGELKHEMNQTDHPEVKKTCHLGNYEDFNFDEFQFKQKKKIHPQARNDDMPAPPIAILGCPLCGLKSKTDFAKTRHMKECAKRSGISSAKILEAVELQKRQAEERRLIGLPIAPSRPARGSRRNTARTKCLEPQTELQADLQMALAMSLSLEQTKKKNEVQERFFLEALTSEPDTEDKKLITALRNGSTSEEKLQTLPAKKTRKKQQVGTPFWLVRSKEETKMIRAERVVKILSEQTTDSDEENCIFIHNWKKIRPYCKIPWPSAGNCRLWEASTLSETVCSDANNFVVSTLKQWFSPTKMHEKQHTVNTRMKRKTEETDCLPSTLAALNALHANNSPTPNDVAMDVSLDGFLLDNTYGDGFFTQAQQEEKINLDFGSEVVQRLLSMVGNKALSDVEIVVKDSEVIPCHQFILYLNCPLAFQEVITSNDDRKLMWTDISRDGAIAFLQFVYGRIFIGSHEKEMLLLASRYKMQNLLKLLSYSSRSDLSNNGQYDEHPSLKLKNVIGSCSPVSIRSLSPSPILHSNLQIASSSSPVLTGESSSLEAALSELPEKNVCRILNESLHCEDLIECEAGLSREGMKHFDRFDPSSRKSRNSHGRLSHISSAMSPDLFSSVHDHAQIVIADVFASNKPVRCTSKLKKNDTPLADFGSPIQNSIPETATSTPIDNKLALSNQKTKTFSISPLLAERSACLQTSQSLRPKQLLGTSKCGESACLQGSGSSIVSETPLINSQDADDFDNNRSKAKIFDEEEYWEKIIYKSGSDAGSNSSPKSFVLESLKNVQNSQETEVADHRKTCKKRKLALVSLTPSPSSKKVKPKLDMNDSCRLSTNSEKRPENASKQKPRVQKSQQSDELVSDDVFESHVKPECKSPGGDRRASPYSSLRLSSESNSSQSVDYCFGQNNTWNDFPEGYHSVDNLQLADGLMPDHNVLQKYDCNYYYSSTPSKRAQLPTSTNEYDHVSQGVNPGNSSMPFTEFEKSVNISDHYNELLDDVPHFGSQKSSWNASMDDLCNNDELYLSDGDLPDIDPCVEANEQTHLNRNKGCVDNCASMSASQSPSSPKKTPAKSRRKRDKKAPKETQVTPMPHYSIMETPVIKKELKKIGVRALPKKKGVTVLKHVYMETHRDTESTSGENGELLHNSNSPTLKGDKTNSKSSSEKGNSHDDSSSSISDGKPGVKKRGISNKNKKVGKAEDTVKTQQCNSQSSEKTSAVNNEELHSFIFCNTDLRRKIVDYQPIDFKRFLLDLKAAGLKPTVQELKDFLDDQCITYTSSEELSPRKSKKQKSRHEKRKR